MHDLKTRKSSFTPIPILNYNDYITRLVRDSVFWDQSGLPSNTENQRSDHDNTWLHVYLSYTLFCHCHFYPMSMLNF
jgi:hypothetical protein